MIDEPPGAEEIFPGSRGAASIVAWIDDRLVEVGEGRREAAREAIDSGHWRAMLDLSGVPLPILEQAAATLAAAAEALGDPAVSQDAAIQALLLARSRFLPGA